jgi:2-hydroxychromene-2-carboxylate isomerase
MSPRRTITWLYDVISPFAYLALPRLPEFAPYGTLEARPVLLAALLQHFGQLGPAEIESKRRFTYRFALWRARRTGLALRLPPAHPFNPLGALRLAIAAGATVEAATTLLQAVFRDGRDVSAPAVLEELARTLGVREGAARVADPKVKEQLRANTEWAIGHGVFGVPTLLIGTELFWGADAIDMALDYLREPAPFEDQAMRAIDSLPVGARRA